VRLRPQLAWLFLLMVAACHGPRSHLIGARSSFRQIDLSFPATKGPPTGFTVCDGGATLVAVGGGVALAGWNGWVLEPGQAPTTDVSCSRGAAYVLKGRSLLRSDLHQQPRLVASLQGDALHLASSRDGGVWIWGKLNPDTSIIHHFDGEALREIYRGPTEVLAVATAGQDSVVSVLGRSIVLWQRGMNPSVIANLDADVDGLVMAPDGSLIVSLEQGIVRIDAAGKTHPLTFGIHGQLVMRSWTLYVLWVAQSRVVRLRPATGKSHLSYGLDAPFQEEDGYEYPKPPSQQGRLRALSTVPARVIIDGMMRGVTPMELMVDEGEHVLRIEADGYKSVETTLHFRKDVLSVIRAGLPRTASQSDSTIDVRQVRDRP
jgi:hypothetical protein